MNSIKQKPKILVQVCSDLNRHEGYRKFAYPDPLSLLGTKYKSQPWGFKPAREILTLIGQPESKGLPWTVGIGYTIGVTPDTTMTPEQAQRKLEDHIVTDLVPQMERVYPEWKTRHFVAQTVLFNLLYNLGPKGLSSFKNTLKFMTSGDYALAGVNLTKSLWYKQVGTRAKELVQRLQTLEIEPKHKA